MRRAFPLIPVFLLALTPALHAVVFSLDGQNYNVEDITGTGANKALFEIDFGTKDVPDTHVFAYQWDATQTFGNMMANLQSDTTTGITYNAFPGFLDTLFYKTQQPPDNYPTSFWNWFSASDTAPAWVFGESAFDTLSIANGGFYGWALQHDDPNIDLPFDAPESAYAPPSHFPAVISAVPEPASLILLIAAAPLILRRRRH